MEFSRIFKFNPYHDKLGKFTSEKGHIVEDAGAQSLMKGYGEAPSPQAVLDKALTKDEANEYQDELKKVVKDVQDGKETNRLYAVPGADNSDGLHYTADRKKLHYKIMDEYMGDTSKYVPPPGKKPIAYILGGRPGAGKSSFESAAAKKFGAPNGVYSKEHFLVLNPDDVKDLLYKHDGVTSGNVATLYHEESSHITRDMIKKAVAGRLNLVYDASLGGNKDAFARKLKQAGYEIRSHFLSTSPEDSAVSSLKRWKGGGKGKRGRLAPLWISLGAVHNEKNFDSLRKYSDEWQLWQRSGDKTIKVPTRGRGS